MRVAYAAFVLVLGCGGAPPIAPAPESGVYVESHVSWPFSLDSVEVFVDGRLELLTEIGLARPAMAAPWRAEDAVVSVRAVVSERCAFGARGSRNSWTLRAARRVQPRDGAHLVVALVASPLDGSPSMHWALRGHAAIGTALYTDDARHDGLAPSTVGPCGAYQPAGERAPLDLPGTLLSPAPADVRP